MTISLVRLKNLASQEPSRRSIAKLYLSNTMSSSTIARMKISLRYHGEECELDVPEGMTIAAAAKLEGMQLFGSCNGNNLCAQCSCEVRDGIDALVKRNGEPYEHRNGSA